MSPYYPWTPVLAEALLHGLCDQGCWTKPPKPGRVCLSTILSPIFLPPSIYSPIHSSILPPFYPSTQLSIHSPPIHPSLILSFFYPWTHPPFHPHTLPSFCLSTHSSIHWFICPLLPFHLPTSIHSFIQLLHPHINLSIHPATILAICPFIHPSIGPLILPLSHSGTST